MAMPGRKFSASAEYRYGFNGKENDNDVKGEGNQQDYGMRIYDPRIGKFLSVDPITSKYPELTPYQFASNRPIDGIDLDGLEYLNYNSSMYRFVTTGPTSETALATVYENIPTQLQNPQTCGLKFSAYRPKNSDGTEYDPTRQGAMFFDNSRYNRGSAQFNGTASDGKSTKDIVSLNGNAIPGVSTTTGDKTSMTNTPNAGNLGAAAGVLGSNGVSGIGQNAWNYLLPWSEQAGLNKEAEKRIGFNKAVDYLDNSVTNGILPTGVWSAIIGSGETMTPQLRGGIINFMADGALDFTKPKSSLKAAWYGIQMLRNNGVDIQSKTKESINSLLEAYKKGGGGTEYDSINQYYENKDD